MESATDRMFCQSAFGTEYRRCTCIEVVDDIVYRSSCWSPASSWETGEWCGPSAWPFCLRSVDWWPSQHTALHARSRCSQTHTNATHATQGSCVLFWRNRRKKSTQAGTQWTQEKCAIHATNAAGASDATAKTQRCKRCLFVFVCLLRSLRFVRCVRCIWLKLSRKTFGKSNVQMRSILHVESLQKTVKNMVFVCETFQRPWLRSGKSTAFKQLCKSLISQVNQSINLSIYVS